jgi:hypothetical protein
MINKQYLFTILFLLLGLITQAQVLEILSPIKISSIPLSQSDTFLLLNNNGTIVSRAQSSIFSLTTIPSSGIVLSTNPNNSSILQANFVLLGVIPIDVQSVSTLFYLYRKQ